MTWTWKKRVSVLVASVILLTSLPYGGIAASPSSGGSELSNVVPTNELPTNLLPTSLVPRNVAPTNELPTEDQSVQPVEQSVQQQNSEVLATTPPTQSAISESITGEDEQRVIVTFKDKKKVDKSLIKGKIKREYKHLPSVSAKMSSKEIEKLKKSAAVESVEPDIQLQAASQTMDWGISVVNATYAWNNGYTGKGVKVAVLDSGINTHHDDLNVAGGASFVSYTSSYDDDFGHGTHVAGIIGAKNNDIGVVGVAPDASLYAVKVLDSHGIGYLSDVIQGIDWGIDNKMDIINLSMATSVDSPSLHRAVDNAHASGLLVVAAAGNTGNAQGSGESLQYPAKYMSVISAGAVDPSHQRAPFSATGNQLEVVGPGTSINSTYLNNAYATLSGTSMAAAFVSGELAILKQKNSAYTNVQLRGQLDQSNEDLGQKGKDSWYGYGLVGVEKGINTIPVDAPAPPKDTVYASVYASVYRNSMISSAGVSITTGANMQFTTYLHTQSVLKDGRVLVSGGRMGMNTICSGTCAFSMIYDPAANKWTDTAYIPLPRDEVLAYHGQSTLSDGRVFITGGTKSKHSSYMYNPSTNSWLKSENYVPVAYTHAQSILNDGRVLVTGGIDDDEDKPRRYSVIFNPISNTWGEVATAAMPKGLLLHSQITLKDGRVLVTGGTDDYDSPKGLNSAYIYDLTTNVWTKAADMPISVKLHSQSVLLNGQVLLTGGELADGTINTNAYLYDPIQNTWSAVMANMPPRFGQAQSTMPDGRVVITGGSDNSNSDNSRTYSTTTIYTINTPSMLTVNPTNQVVLNQAGQVITLSGTVNDMDNNNVTISASIGGITKSVVVSNTMSSPVWTLQWVLGTDNVQSNAYTNITITANDGFSTSSTTFVGSITIDQSPNISTNLIPTGSSASPAFIAGTTPVLTWGFSDPDSGDSQSAYEVVLYEGANVILDTGWVSSSASSYTLPTGKLIRGKTYSWKVNVKDRVGIASNFTGLSYFRTNTIPTLSLTSYSDGQTVPDNKLTFTWTYADTDGQQQASYQVLGTQDNWSTIGYNSGVQSGNSAAFATPPLASGTWSFKVLASDGFEWSAGVLRNNVTLPNAYEPNDTSSQAFAVNYGQNYSSLISSASDIDFYTYKAAATGIDRITVNVPSGLNYDVFVYDASLNLITSGNRIAGLSENVLYDVTVGSTYYIKLAGVSGNFSAAVPYFFKLNKAIIQAQSTYQYDSNGNITNKTTTTTHN
ncbi:S8 family serine peptidase [Paenibacillus sp. SYP-B3998]|uniref:S8 family serine peptidase n=1 Tax=Paenibacillus sp. SYP-B3998 TaxID=2678564 RepID=A0A6G3ZSW2_9BACL|nr:S8 family serine peptidase [Paenibacillus sp. SYP-B3998]NEW04679.1 S8 family serine peptidase [Paenibacillus sp. SYP-B3998]